MLWENLKLQPPAWLKEHDIPADLLNEFYIENNSVSVYEIESTQSNLDDVQASLAANRKYLTRFDYMLLDTKIILTRGWQLHKVAGATHNQFVNQNYHFDVVNLSGKNMVTFGNQIIKKSTIGSVSPKDIKTKINACIKNGFISENDLEPSLVKALHS